MKYIIPLVFAFALLPACAGPYPQRTGKPIKQLAWAQTFNPETGKPAKYWFPEFDKEENVDPIQARQEERRCIYKLYDGKNISEVAAPQHDAQNPAQKIASSGGRIRFRMLNKPQSLTGILIQTKLSEQRKAPFLIFILT